MLVESFPEGSVQTDLFLHRQANKYESEGQVQAGVRDIQSRRLLILPHAFRFSLRVTVRRCVLSITLQHTGVPVHT